MSDLEKLRAAWEQVVNEKKAERVAKEEDDVEDDDADSSDDEKKEKPKKGVNPFKKKDDDEDSKEEDISNFGNKRAKPFKKEELEKGKKLAFMKKKGEKDDEDSSDDKDDKKEKPVKGENPFKKKADKDSEKVDEGKVECPKCKGEGCDHCDDKGYHMEEMYRDSSVKRSTGKRMDPKSPASKSNARLSKKIADGPQYKTKDWKYKKEEVELDEAAPTSMQIKQGMGIARDKRYKGGNMTGAVNAMMKIHPQLHKHPQVAKELKKQNEELEMYDTLKKVEERRTMKWSDFSEAYDEITYKDKKRPQDRPLGKSDEKPASPGANQPQDMGGKGNSEFEKHTYGGTPPEGMFDKESVKSKEFIKLHQQSDPKWENLEDESHEDASKAGRGVKTQSPNRMGRDHRETGDKNVVNPITQKY